VTGRRENIGNWKRWRTRSGRIFCVAKFLVGRGRWGRWRRRRRRPSWRGQRRIRIRWRCEIGEIK